MAIFRKIFLLLVFILSGFLTIGIAIDAGKQSLIIDGKAITLKDGTKIEIDTEYKVNGGQFRAVWISAFTSDISGFTSEESYKAQFTSVFNVMEQYNLNAMLFHVRVMNDAFYESEYNSWSTYYNTNPTWDALPWIINECHKRGIEFHAWMNPYRVTSNVSKSLEEIANAHKSTNIASDPQNLLKGTTTVILNPGEPAVRNWLVKVCMELIENYDVDAIHFDDYFYVAGIDDSQTRAQYNPTGLSTDDWRREQINLFIKDLSEKMRAYNRANGRGVQLGVSPTGAYRNGNGVVTYDTNGNAITNGSNTGAYAHYGSPLYADTLKWINEEWIDYIIPQTYWGITNSSGPFCELVSWWDKVVKYKNVNLYVALGLYMSDTTGNASWSTNPYEGYHEIMYANTLENIKGICVYSYSSLANTLGSSKAFNGVSDIWNKPIIPVEMKTMTPIVLEQPSNLKVVKNDAGYKLSFDKNPNAKFYVIYKSTSPLTYSDTEVLDVIGDVSVNGVVYYPDIDVINGIKYYYGVKVLSASNTLGTGTSVDTTQASVGSLVDFGGLEGVGISDNVYPGETIRAYWKKLYYPFGTAINYKLTYDFGGAKTEVTTFGQFRNMPSCEIKIPIDALEINIKIEAYNNIGQTTNFISKDIAAALGKVTNFSNLDSVANKKEVTFIFNSLKIKGVQYTLQYSRNQIDWNDEVSIVDNSDDFNLKIKSTIDKKSGEIYFRIKAEKDGKSSYSSEKKYILSDYLGEFSNFEVMNMEAENYLLVSLVEKDKLIIGFDKHGSNALYSVYISSDLKNWLTLSTYTTSYQVTNTDTQVMYQIPINYKYMKMYVKVIALFESAQTESFIIEVYCQVNDLYSDTVVDYFYKDILTTIRKMEIFN